jgi:hypothetical protein
MTLKVSQGFNNSLYSSRQMTIPFIQQLQTACITVPRGRPRYTFEVQMLLSLFLVKVEKK